MQKIHYELIIPIHKNERTIYIFYRMCCITCIITYWCPHVLCLLNQLVGTWAHRLILIVSNSVVSQQLSPTTTSVSGEHTSDKMLWPIHSLRLWTPLLRHLSNWCQSTLLLGFYSLRRRRFISIGIAIINLRRSSDRLRFIMGIPIPIRRRLLSEKRPWSLLSFSHY